MVRTTYPAEKSSSGASVTVGSSFTGGALVAAVLVHMPPRLARELADQVGAL
jgi:hypothetical protein